MWHKYGSAETVDDARNSLNRVFTPVCYCHPCCEQYQSAQFQSEFIKSKCNYEKWLFAEENTTGKFYAYVKSQTSVKDTIPCIQQSDGVFADTDYEKVVVRDITGIPVYIAML